MRDGIKIASFIVVAALYMALLPACNDGPNGPSTCEVALLLWDGVTGSDHIIRIEVTDSLGRDVEDTFEVFVDGVSVGAHRTGDTIDLDLPAIPPGGGPPAPAVRHDIRVTRDGCSAFATVTVPL